MYEVGDRIRITYVHDSLDPYKVGDCGTIIEVDEYNSFILYKVRFDNDKGEWWVYYDEIELIEDESMDIEVNNENKYTEEYVGELLNKGITIMNKDDVKLTFISNYKPSYEHIYQKKMLFV